MISGRPVTSFLNPLKCPARAWIILLAHLTASAGPADTAWDDLFNGKDFAGLYVFNYNDGKPVYDSSLSGNALFKPVGGEIRCTTSGGQRGHIATRKDYSFFHMKVDWKIASGNSGVMYHLREDLAMANPLTRLYSVFPPSIEAQGEKGNGGDCWVISNVWMDTRATNNKYAPNGLPITIGGVSEGGRMLAASAHYDLYGTANPSGWNTLEVIAYGSDSVVHIVNGHANFRGWNIKYTPGNAPTSPNPPKPPFEKIPFGYGRLSLQAEMSPVSYRNWKVAELVGCKDPKATNFKAYLSANRSEDCRYATGIPARKPRTRKSVSAPKVWMSPHNGVSGSRSVSGRLHPAAQTSDLFQRETP